MGPIPFLAANSWQLGKARGTRLPSRRVEVGARSGDAAALRLLSWPLEKTTRLAAAGRQDSAQSLVRQPLPRPPSGRH